MDTKRAAAPLTFVVMGKHIYLVVTCKTPLCGRVGAVRYHGVQRGQLDLSGVPEVGFVYDCVTCGGIHRFETSETRVEAFDFEPPFGWQGRF
jgi:hypothetical protein